MTIINIKCLKLHRFTIINLMEKFNMDREQALKLHHAILADYDQIVKQIPTIYN